MWLGAAVISGLLQRYFSRLAQSTWCVEIHSGSCTARIKRRPIKKSTTSLGRPRPTLTAHGWAGPRKDNASGVLLDGAPPQMPQPPFGSTEQLPRGVASKAGARQDLRRCVGTGALHLAQFRPDRGKRMGKPREDRGSLRHRVRKEDVEVGPSKWCGYRLQRFYDGRSEDQRPLLHEDMT